LSRIERAPNAKQLVTVCPGQSLEHGHLSQDKFLMLKQMFMQAFENKPLTQDGLQVIAQFVQDEGHKAFEHRKFIQEEL
jgi:hypothetical protein